MAAVPAGVDFTPLMTLYLTDRTTYVAMSRFHAPPSNAPGLGLISLTHVS